MARKKAWGHVSQNGLQISTEGTVVNPIQHWDRGMDLMITQDRVSQSIMPLKIFSLTLSMSSDNYFILPLWKALLLSGPLTEKRHYFSYKWNYFQTYSNVDCYFNKNAVEVKIKTLWSFMCSDSHWGLSLPLCTRKI